MYKASLLADPHSIYLERIVSSDKSLTLVVRTKRRAATCPQCAQSSRRVHSRYVRHVADLPWHGVAVRMELHTRRFFCTQDACAQHVFCERLPQVVAVLARRSTRLNDAHKESQSDVARRVRLTTHSTGTEIRLPLIRET